MDITTTTVLLFLQAASEDESDRMKITVREVAAVLAAEQHHALVYPAPARVLAPALEEAEEELDVPRNGFISAISAMILDIPLWWMSCRKKKQAMENERK